MTSLSFPCEVEQAIQRASHGRIEHLQIEPEANFVVVRGQADSYYALQLAIESVRRLHARADRQPVRMAITVQRSATGACQ